MIAINSNICFDQNKSAIDELKCHLEMAGIKNEDLMRKTSNENSSFCASKAVDSISQLFPLEWFDDGETSPIEKFTITDELPIPALAFLPRIDRIASKIQLQKLKEGQNEPSDWSHVLIHSYNTKHRAYRITESSTSLYIPKIYVKITTEEPAQFVARLNNALNDRKRHVLSLKMGTILDCMCLKELPLPSGKIREKIRNFIGNSNTQNQERLTAVEHEAFLDYLCVEGMLEIKRFYRKNNLFGKHGFSTPLYLKIKDDFIEQNRVASDGEGLIERKKAKLKKHQFLCGQNACAFKEATWQFKLSSVFCHPETVNVMHQLLLENELLAKQNFFTASMERSTLTDFVMSQKSTTAATISYLRDTWTHTCINVVRKTLLPISRKYVK